MGDGFKINYHKHLREKVLPVIRWATADWGGE